MVIRRPKSRKHTVSDPYLPVPNLSQWLPLLTTQSLWGYISHTAAKSVVGIGVPEFGTVHNRASGFFMR